MAGAHTKHHDYHLVDPSPWPLVGAASATIMAIGAVMWMKAMPVGGMQLGPLVLQLLNVVQRVAAGVAARALRRHEANSVVLAQCLRVHLGELCRSRDREDRGETIHLLSRLRHELHLSIVVL